MIPDDSECLPGTGITNRQWLRKCAEVRVDRKGFGLSPLSFGLCNGGYCRRHNAKRPLAYKTSEGHLLCSECAVLWAVRHAFNLPRELDDL